MYFEFDSFTMPSTIYRYDFDSDSLAVVGSLKAPVDLSNIEVRQVWYPSKDGTPVSMFIVARKGLKRDGTNPAYLYGYGGFNISMTPYYSSNVAFWLDAGGVYALPNIRGGGEYGKEWHDNGKLEKKQNSFDDFIAAAQYLIDSGYTNTNKLAISGGSNGGLLVGAVLTQRPDLFKAVVCAVPLLDMLRYQDFQVARLWIPEYGSSEDSSQFQYLLKYSPYQHVTKGVAYPAVLLTAGESDSRVDPLHARKMAAELQAATSSDNPILLYVEMNAGHGQGKPVSKRIEDAAGTWSFVFRALGIKYGE
jgi:prolyl oligopeptidase